MDALVRSGLATVTIGAGSDAHAEVGPRLRVLVVYRQPMSGRCCVGVHATTHRNSRGLGRPKLQTNLS